MSAACDVLVIGLGPAGASAAAAAARAGANVIAIDRRRLPGEPVQCAEFAPMLLGAETPALRAAFRQSIVEMTTFLPGGGAHRNADFRGAMIDRRAFDRALCEDARASGADLRFGVTLTALDADGVAQLNDGSRIAARAVVGADGPRSRVGAAVGIENRELLETRQFAAPLLNPCGSTDIHLEADIVGGYAWMFPKGDVANVGLGVEADARARLKPLLATLRDRLIAQGIIGEAIHSWTGGAIPVGGPHHPVATRAVVGVLLAGDAAGLVNPVTGAGIPAAFVSGELAGEAAARFARGETGALENYAEDLDERFGASLRRALQRRAEMREVFRRDTPPRAADWRRGWIAFPEYWAA